MRPGSVPVGQRPVTRTVRRPSDHEDPMTTAARLAGVGRLRPARAGSVPARRLSEPLHDLDDDPPAVLVRTHAGRAVTADILVGAISVLRAAEGSSLAASQARRYTGPTST
jgi:hypothetical protein